MSEIVPYGADAVRVGVAVDAQPHEIVLGVSPTLGAVDAVVDVDARSHVAEPAQRPFLLEPEAGEQVRVSHSRSCLEVRGHDGSPRWRG
jgi:hypothetical protein